MRYVTCILQIIPGCMRYVTCILQLEMTRCNIQYYARMVGRFGSALSKWRAFWHSKCNDLRTFLR